MNKQDHPTDRDPTDQFELKLEDTVAQQSRGVPVRARSAVSGYNPYDAAEPVAEDPRPGEPQRQRKPTDLRKLSEWIRLQRQVEALKKEEP